MNFYHTIIVGTGFASSFFLKKLLEKTKKTDKILVIERGKNYSHREHITKTREISDNSYKLASQKNSIKTWLYTSAFGGGSNCWWACTPRFHPSDFKMKSNYGILNDWPLNYSELEEYYIEAEDFMAIAGERNDKLFPRSKDYPIAPHNLSEPDKVLKKAYPDLFVPQPCARARLATKNRPQCCASGTCGQCPINAKFTVQNEMQELYNDSRVTLLTNAEALNIDFKGGVANGLIFKVNEKIEYAKADIIALGANGIFNPEILYKSGIRHKKLGKGLNEQLGKTYIFDLDNLDAFQGSTSITGHGYMLYDGEFRSKYSGALLEFWNVPRIRLEEGKWQQRLEVKVICEDIPSDENYIKFNNDNQIPEIHFANYNSYAHFGIKEAEKKLKTVLNKLPIEKLVNSYLNKTEGHIIGTTIMGIDKKESLVDKYQRLHTNQNIYVLGSGNFPTATPSNPSLTISALSLFAADNL
jgi:choline dehydrogenase-like flavoprotein